MKLLVATMQTQHQCATDFCFVAEGELVTIEEPCDKDRDTDGVPLPDGVCGCGRAFTGVLSRTGTTTARVIDNPEMTPEALAMILSGHDGGFGATFDDAIEEVSALCEMLLPLPLGAIVER